MPTYDYICNACGHEFEHFQSMTSPVMKKCPECGRLKLERLIGTGAGVLFKGGGFYETDYRSDSYKKAAEAEKKGEKGDTDKKSGDTKGDTKKDVGGGDSGGGNSSKPAASSSSDSKSTSTNGDSSPKNKSGVAGPNAKKKRD